MKMRFARWPAISQKASSTRLRGSIAEAAPTTRFVRRPSRGFTQSRKPCKLFLQEPIDVADGNSRHCVSCGCARRTFGLVGAQRLAARDAGAAQPDEPAAREFGEIHSEHYLGFWHAGARTEQQHAGLADFGDGRGSEPFKRHEPARGRASE